MSAVVEVLNLTKQFQEVTAVKDLSFTVSKGEVYGFLGQNGAGKSTTIRMLLSLIRPTSGTVSIFGKNLAHHRREILQKTGAIIEKPDLYKYLSAYKNIEIMARLSGMKPTRQDLMNTLEKVGLSERAESRVKTFSQGMKQRLGIGCALIHNPDLLVLDEPTNGLDPQGIADVRNLILHLSKDEGKTIFVSSHLLSEIELIVDSMLIIDRGRKVAEGKASALLNPSDTIVHLETGDNEVARRELSQSAWANSMQPSDDTILLRMDRQAVPELNRFLVSRGIDVIALKPKHSLEDFFLSLTTSNQHVAAYGN